MRRWKQYLSGGLCAILLLGATACGGASGTSNNMGIQSNAYLNGATAGQSKAAALDYGYATDSAYESYDMAEFAVAEGEPSYRESSSGSTRNSSGDTVTESQSASEQNTSRKLIRNVNMSVETKEFDAFLVAVEEQVNALGGYIESMDTYNGSRYNQYTSAKRSNLTVRIPQKKLDTFLDAVSEAGNVISRGESVEDVTLTYVDMESRKKSLQTEMDRLQEFLEKAETLEDIITLEDRMATVRYQLESMESQLRTYDNMVDYSTVDMNIQEVKELTPVIEDEETTWERLSRGFMESLDDIKDGFVEFGIWFVIHIPYLAVFAVIVILFVLIIKGLIRHGHKKKAAKLAKKNAAGQQLAGQTAQQNAAGQQATGQNEAGQNAAGQQPAEQQTAQGKESEKK